MMGSDVTMLDGAIIAVLMIAVARGLFIGLIRESLSIAALGLAVLATRYGTPAAASWLQETSDGAIGPSLAPWIMGAAIGAGTVAVVTMLARFIRRGVRLAGLGFADRMGGAALGAAEGFLVAMLIVLGATFAMGREHPVVARSRSLEAYDLVRNYVDENAEELPGVAAPGRWP